LQKNILKEKKKVILLLSVLFILGFALSGCNWFGEGILNVFDPKAAIRVNFTEIDFTEGEGSIDLEIYSINEVEFIGEGFSYKYYNKGVLIPELSKTVGTAFYVEPSDNPGNPGPITDIDSLPLYYREVSDYVRSNPMVTEITCTISLIGTDGAGHSLSKSVTFDLPAVQPGIDFTPPDAVINVTPGTTGNAPFTVQFDASGSTDDRGIASYSWDFGDGSSGTGVMPAAHTYVSGVYIVKLTVTDYWGNTGYDTVVINVGDSAVGAPIASIQVSPSSTGNAPFTVAFDGSGSSVSSESDCGCSIASYSWDFGDGSSGTGIATTHTYEDPGTYVVILSLTDTNGKIGYATVVITVTSDEDASIDSITLYANPETNIPGGISTINAVVTNTEGDSVPDDTVVNFVTNNGTLSATTANTVNGIASVDLELSASMQSGDIATVTAFIGAISGTVDVECVSVVGPETESIIVNANPESNVPGGISTIQAIVLDSQGNTVEDGTTVYFYTNSGTLSAETATTTNGIATVSLTLNNNMQTGEKAKVTAFIGSISGYIEVTCIDVIVVIYADSSTITPGGISNITAVVTDTSGDPVDDGIIVVFYSKDASGDTIGTINPVYDYTTNGIATTQLTLSNSGDEAIITAKCGSRVSDPIEIVCE
jgi:PKD repeat protein